MGQQCSKCENAVENQTQTSVIIQRHAYQKHIFTSDIIDQSKDRNQISVVPQTFQTEQNIKDSPEPYDYTVVFSEKNKNGKSLGESDANHIKILQNALQILIDEETQLQFKAAVKAMDIIACALNDDQGRSQKIKQSLTSIQENFTKFLQQERMLNVLALKVLMSSNIKSKDKIGMRFVNQTFEKANSIMQRKRQSDYKCVQQLRKQYYTLIQIENFSQLKRYEDISEQIACILNLFSKYSD